MKSIHFNKRIHTIIFIIVLLFLKTTYGNKININVKLSHKRHYKARYHDYHTKKHHKQQHHHHNKEKTHHKESKKTESNSKKSSNNIGENNNGVITKTFTFKDLNLLSDDLVLKGVNPRYDFYIPTLPQMVSGKVYLNIKTYPYLRKDSTITILLNNIPYETFKADNIPSEIDIPIKKSKNNFVKISISGDLHISENVCVDAFSDKLYIIVSKNSKVEFNYKKPDNNIREFLIDYNNDYCIYSPTLIPFIYQMCKENPIPCKVYYNQNIKNCKKIEPSNDNNLILNKNTLYVPVATTTKAFENGIFPSYLFGEAERINKAIVENKTAKTEVSLKELGIKTTTIEGVSNLNYTIPI
ncbi:cellulose biosynthesis cyclic di-GMP-binding regulatory protein BcsB, partial [Hydrogenobaculum sp.]